MTVATRLRKPTRKSRRRLVGDDTLWTLNQQTQLTCAVCAGYCFSQATPRKRRARVRCDNCRRQGYQP